MRDHRPVLVGAAVVVFVIAVVVALGAVNPPREGAVATDRLGPEQGEQVSAYLSRAAHTLRTSAGQRYALASLTAEITPKEAAALAVGLRVSQVHYRVPIPRVQTPLVVVGVGLGSEAIDRSAVVAAAQSSSAAALHTRADQSDARAGQINARAVQINAVATARLGNNCACVVALTVRGEPEALSDLASRDGVRSVEALPDDAVFGRFSVTPLLPEHVDVVGPGPDDGAVPPN